MPVIYPEHLYRHRVNAIRRFHKSANQPKAELDLSGGIDSAVMACLLVEALGKDNVLLVHTRINTEIKQTDRATRLAKALGAPFVDVNLTPVFDLLTAQMLDNLSKVEGVDPMSRVQKDPTILGSIRSTLRAPVGRGFNRMFGGGIRHGTGNECEDRFLRFFQKGGDGEVDTNPIEMLSKTEVYQLAYYIMMKATIQNMTDLAQALRDTIETKPSPDLWGKGDEHNDEDELTHWTGVPFNYGRIDVNTGKILRFGTIERMSRLLDQPFSVDEFMIKPECWGSSKPPVVCEDVIFGGPDYDWAINFVMVIANRTGCFPYGEDNQFNAEQVKAFIKAAAKAESATRHKSNTNIPILGTRQELVDVGILSNYLGSDIPSIH